MGRPNDEAVPQSWYWTCARNTDDEGGAPWNPSGSSWSALQTLPSGSQPPISPLEWSTSSVACQLQTPSKRWPTIVVHVQSVDRRFAGPTRKTRTEGEKIARPRLCWSAASRQKPTSGYGFRFGKFMKKWFEDVKSQRGEEFYVVVERVFELWL